MILIGKYYPYSTKGTLLSYGGNIGAYLSGLGALVCFFSYEKSLLLIPLGVIFLAIAVFLFFYVSIKLSKKVGEAESEKNIRTKVSYALKYCKKHPDKFAQVASENEKFAEKYAKDEKGKIVKKNKLIL
ncbi:MAG: hypothetical protein K5884_07080 [Ruminococcus sp.]|nr:hypothetical protein [Ruminococcus sp.]